MTMATSISGSIFEFWTRNVCWMYTTSLELAQSFPPIRSVSAFRRRNAMSSRVRTSCASSAHCIWKISTSAMVPKNSTWWFFPKQFAVEVRNSFSKGVRLFQCVFHCYNSLVSQSGWGCPACLPLCLPLSPTVFPTHGPANLGTLSPSGLPLVSGLQLCFSTCLPVVVRSSCLPLSTRSVCLSGVFHHLFLTISHFISPFIPVASCFCFITSFVIGPYPCFFLRVFLLSQELHQHRPQIAETWKNVVCDSCCSQLKWTTNYHHQDLV